MAFFRWPIWLVFFAIFLRKSHAAETIGGLPIDTEYLELRDLLKSRVVANSTEYFTSYAAPDGSFNVSIRCDSGDLRIFENSGQHNLTCSLSYSSNANITLNISSDYTVSVEMVDQNYSKHLPQSLEQTTQNLTIPIRALQIGEAYILIRVKIGAAEFLALGLRIIVLRESGIVDLIFRIGLIILLILATFFMGCDVDLDVVKSYATRPVGPAIGFLCQFLIMPAVSLDILLVSIDNVSFF